MVICGLPELVSIRAQAVRMEGERPADPPAPRFTGDPEMRQDLLSVRIVEQDGQYPAENTQPTYDAVDTLNKEIWKAGAWVFAGGLHLSSTATVFAPRTARCSLPTVPTPRARSRSAAPGSSRPPTSTTPWPGLERRQRPAAHPSSFVPSRTTPRADPVRDRPRHG